MARRVKHERPVDWHVFNRGSRRMALFRDEQDAGVFLALLRKALEVSGCALWAYTLMTNHFHLALRGDSRQICRCLHYVEWLYSTYHNKRYGLSGAAFEGRYEAYPQGTLPMLLRTIVYIFLNPVAAGLADGPADYSWSNYGAIVSGGDCLGLKGDVDLLLTRIEAQASLPSNWLQVYTAREMARIRRGEHRPGLSAKDLQANHFDWLLEEAKRQRNLPPPFSPVILAIYWAKLAGFHRGALVKALGGALSSTQRSHLTKFRQWIDEDSSRAALVELP